MPFTPDIMSFTLGAALGAGLAYLLLRGKQDSSLQRHLAEKASALEAQVQDLLQKNARLETALEKESAALAGQMKMLEETKNQMKDVFKSLSNEALRGSHEDFLKLAEARLSQAQENARNDLEKKETAIKGLVDPVQKHLEALHKTVGEIEKTRASSFAELAQNISLIRGDHEKLRSTTSLLAQALRSPTSRGRWGELHLQRALESLGMLETVDFIQQDHQRTEDGAFRPDVIVHLPGKRSIVIDAKTPIDAWLDAMQEGISEEARENALARHVAHIRGHIAKLSSKAYWKNLDSPEFVLMFLPGDHYYAAALEKDPSLFDTCVENKVFVMTPTTLFPTLRVIEHAWKQEKLAENAKEISKLGNELYDRLGTFMGHLSKIEKGLTSAITGYNSAIVSFNDRIAVTGRKLRDKLGSGEETPDLPQIEKAPLAAPAPAEEEKRLKIAEKA